ncbi:MAG: PIN domain-containing protein [Coriobacteriia bacterium]|nr:PIN domain-containing protein [Coriobacteriia bacterium]
MRTEAYVDTSALIAFADASDRHHRRFKDLFADPPALLTSELVVAEGHGWFLRRFDRSHAMRFLSMVDAMPFTVAAVGHDERTAAITVLSRFGDQKLTLADALGLHLMETHRVGECWSTDFHLGLTGVPLVGEAR